LRDYEGFAETRRLQLVKDPAVRENWIAYAAASYMAGNYDICLSTIESILRIHSEDTDKKKKPLQPQNLMEIHTMFVKCQEQKGNFELALSYIQKNEQAFLDRLWLEDAYGRLY